MSVDFGFTEIGVEKQSLFCEALLPRSLIVQDAHIVRHDGEKSAFHFSGAVEIAADASKVFVHIAVSMAE